MAEEIDSNHETLRICRTPWKGQLVLACGKCQKKLKHDGNKSKLSKLSKQLKKLARRDETGPVLHIVNVSCLKLCPKGGVTVCSEQQLMRGECSIVRTRSDVRKLLEQLKSETRPTSAPGTNRRSLGFARDDKGKGGDVP